ncbi:MAG: RNA methyltransferase [Cyclobacteriaceae bacterium]|nr:RNA methyltransferase [Cyclobacteriaceae bacterium]
MNKIKHLDYLESYLTPHRKSLFDKIAALRTRHFTIVAEDTYQDHNASALIRNCDCFGIQDLHILEEHQKYRLAKGMTQGSEKWVGLHYYSEFENCTQTCIDTLREQGYAIIATTPHENDYLINEYDVSKKSAFFFGRETTGLSKQVLDQADGYIKIPMFGFSESFNISVSVALLLQSLMGRLRASNSPYWRLTQDEIIDLKIDWCIKTIQNGDRISANYLAQMEK